MEELGDFGFEFLLRVGYAEVVDGGGIGFHDWVADGDFWVWGCHFEMGACHGPFPVPPHSSH